MSEFRWDRVPGPILFALLIIGFFCLVGVWTVSRWVVHALGIW
jgi:hypothetical protein